MALFAVTNSPTSPGTGTLEEQFRRLEATVLDEVEDISCQAEVIHHPAFREILSLGAAVVPLMLRDLDERPRLWVWALPELTGADPVSPTEVGKITHMSLAWLRWARENGYKTKGIEDHFPELRGIAFEVTGPRDPAYNCIAWAAGVSDTWWHPTGDPEKTYWPAGIPREQTLAASQVAFESLGYAVCEHADLEPGYEKVALFHNPACGRFTLRGN
jgi:hypothetical protein